MIALSDRAFVVSFAEIDRWDPGSFYGVSWHWPAQDMKPIGSVLKMRKEKIDRSQSVFSDLQPVTIHFDGSMDRRKVDADREYTMELFAARPGDVVVAKIDLKNGAVGIVPPDWENVVVTGHFAAYEPDLSQLVPEYLHLIIQTPFFKQYLWRNKVGAEGRKEVKLSFFESVKVPLPPLAVQQAIVEYWHTAQREAAGIREHLIKSERVLSLKLYEGIGTPPPALEAAAPRCMVLPWHELDRWSFGYLARARQGMLGFTQSIYPIVPLSECLRDTANGYSIKPVLVPTPYRMLKLNALTPAGLDPDKNKYVPVTEALARRFSIAKGDLLICRSSGSPGQVAKCALVDHDEPSILFPDIIIRARFRDMILPEYAREVIQSPLGRSYFRSNARTAVGMWKIGAEDIRNFPMPLPPLDVQREIVARVQEGRTEIARETARADALLSGARSGVEAMILGTLPPPAPNAG